MGRKLAPRKAPTGWQPLLWSMKLMQKETFENTPDDKAVKRARRAIKTFYRKPDNPPYYFRTKTQRLPGTFTIERVK